MIPNSSAYRLWGQANKALAPIRRERTKPMEKSGKGLCITLAAVLCGACGQVSSHSPVGQLSRGLIGQNGVFLNGMDWNGIFLNGLDWNGQHLNGYDFNGLFLNGFEWNGLEVNGSSVSGVEV